MLRVDAGGFAKGYGPTAKIQTQFVVKGLKKLGYDAINLSYKDFYLGSAYLKEIEKKQDVKFISGNIFYEDGNAFAMPYVIKELTPVGNAKLPFKKIKVGILGLGDEREQLLRRKSDEPQLKSTNSVEAAQKIVPKLRKKTDLVILLYNGKFRNLEALLNNVKGIDVVVMGGEYYSVRRFGDGGYLVVSSPSLGKYGNYLSLTLDSNKKIIAHRERSVALDEKIKEDAAFVKLVKEFEEARKENARKKPVTSLSH